MSSDLAGSAQVPSTRRGLGRGNGHVGSGPGASEPTPVGNKPTGPPGAAVDLVPDRSAVLALWERERLLEERERIADDLHDHVIARLFAAALNLERVVGTLGPGPLAAQQRSPSTAWTRPSTSYAA